MAHKYTPCARSSDVGPEGRLHGLKKDLAIDVVDDCTVLGQKAQSNDSTGQKFVSKLSYMSNSNGLSGCVSRLIEIVSRSASSKDDQ